MVNTEERSCNVVTPHEPKRRIGSSPTGTVAGRGFLPGPLVDIQGHRRTERTSPMLVATRNTASPRSSEPSGGSRKASQGDSGSKRAEHAHALLEWEGEEEQEQSTGKRWRRKSSGRQDPRLVHPSTGERTGQSSTGTKPTTPCVGSQPVSSRQRRKADGGRGKPDHVCSPTR